VLSFNSKKIVNNNIEMSLSLLNSPNMFNQYITANFDKYGQMDLPNSMSASNIANSVAVANVNLAGTDVFYNIVNALYAQAGNAVLPEPEAALAPIAAPESFPVGYNFDFVLQNNSAGAFAVTLAASASGRFSIAAGSVVIVAQNAALRFHCMVSAVGAQPSIVCYSVGVLSSNVDPGPMSPYMDGTIFTGTPAAAINYTTSTATQILNAIGKNSPQFIGRKFYFTISNFSNANVITLVGGAGVTVNSAPAAGNVVGSEASKQVCCLITNVGANASILMVC